MSERDGVGLPASLGYEETNLMPEHAMGDLEGVLLAHLESFGFTERQVNAAKGLIRQAVWDWFRRWATYITSEEHTNLRKVVEEPRRHEPIACDRNEPVRL
jgi:hypothetical protein